MSVTGNETYNPRTYGKRSAMKRKQGSQLELEKKQATSPDSTFRKRRKVSPDTVARTPSPTISEEAMPFDVETSPPSGIPTVKDTYSPPRKPTTRPSSPQISPVRHVKPVRDLSSIFDAIKAPASPISSPTKLAKRMLARSKTESSIESESKARGNTVDRTFSLPSIPSSPSGSGINTTHTSSSSNNILPILPSATKSSTTRTYAGKFRSFLVTLPSASAPNAQTLEDDEGFDTRESYNSLRSRWGVDNSEDDPYPYASPPLKSHSATPDISPSRSSKGKSKSTPSSHHTPPIPYGMSNPLKSISELRNKGESRRFLDELGYLFEGMDKNGGLGLRRASALEITTKLCDADFARKAKAADFYTRTWDLFLEAGAGKDDDKILDILVSFFAALVARDPASVAELAQRPPAILPLSSISSKRKSNVKQDENGSFVGTLFNIMDNISPDADPLILVAHPGTDSELKKAGITKKDRSMLATVYKIINSKFKLFFSNTPISVSLLISHTLQSLPPATIPTKHFPIFLRSLRLSLAPVSGTSLFSSVALRWRDAIDAVPYQSVYYHLRLLDAYLLHQWESPLDDSSQSPQGVDSWKGINDQEIKSARDTWLADDLVTFGLCAEIGDANDESEIYSTSNYLDITLRVLVSLTHSDERWGRKVVEGDYSMGLLMRTIYRAARELQLSKSQVTQDDRETKREEREETTPPADDDPTKNWRLHSQALDTLCLALGLLTNLVQITDSAKRIVQQIRLSPSCTLKKRVCARKCVCSHTSSAIEILTDVYAQQQVKIESTADSFSEDLVQTHAEADASYLRGHLAVLFGLLMMDCPENESQILSALPSPFTTMSPTEMLQASKRAKLGRLVEQAKDFTAFYTAVSSNLGGEKESKIANEVVYYLESERDAVI